MAHKVHPKAYRIRENADWDSRWYHKTPGLLLEEDFKVRDFLKKKLNKIGVEKIEIERSLNKLNIIITTPRPGLIIGRGGEGVDLLKKEIERKIIKNTGKEKKEIRIEIREIKNPWTSAASTATWVAQQIEKRMPYRKVMKQAIQKTTVNKEIKGVKVELSGRLNGADIARREWLSSGRLPLQTIRADIDYAKAEAFTTFGIVGIKFWLYKGDKFDE
ncbi:MAG: 30S ribosomal protein S3 [Candidatus Pacebacteria bacterium]|nr:30S ribosomal protein S3 [Candidatus Paceibacterota bacterium]MDD3072148.1 30S ribosomal protein S3 [Candidatus Paceibacterota bacterium]MDD3728787.1 30S ribosomal protein S3 [Candidatus Paceibacterota bacterium]MDD4201354.1 30S ribosomal protein S3 [Candidatus Paceibacterota bacterium]MDD4466911.1 30S ribosomal protein S3 [Candidatus Paceibacterota bacterium]